MSGAGVILDARISQSGGPFPVNFGGSTFVFWRDEHENGIVFASKTNRGLGGYGAWSNRASVPGQVGILPGTEPVAAVLGKRLHLFWHGSGRDGFFYTSTEDGNRWERVESVKSKVGALGIGGDHSPCLAVHDNRIHLFWRGLQDREGMFHASYDGAAWEYHDSLQPRIASHGAQPKTMPAAIAIPKGPLYLFWSGSGKDGLFYATLSHGNWSGARSMRDHLGNHGIRDGASPSVSGVGDGFYMFWHGSGGDGLYWTRHDGKDFLAGQRHVFTLARVAGAQAPRALYGACAASPEKTELYWRDEGSGRLFFVALRAHANWMARAEGALSLGKLNLPGTHDTAAIDRNLSPSDAEGSVSSDAWDCQNLSIREQLEQGVRMLDIRIQLLSYLKSSDGDIERVELYTCHGDFGVGMNFNRYQSLESAFEEITGFLADHKTETVVVLIKIDEEKYFYRGYRLFQGMGWKEADLSDDTRKNALRADALKRLSDLIGKFSGSIHKTPPGAAGARVLPKLRDVRGKIFLLNRISSEPALHFGYNLDWRQNKDDPTQDQVEYSDWVHSPKTAAEPANPAPVKIALQDRFEDVTREEKFKLFRGLPGRFPTADVLINYASYTRGFQHLGKPLIQKELLEAWDAKPASVPRPGWALFDFATYYLQSSRTGEACNAIDYVIATNTLSWDPGAAC